MVKPTIVVEFTPLLAIHRSGMYIGKYGTVITGQYRATFLARLLILIKKGGLLQLKFGVVGVGVGVGVGVNIYLWAR